MLPLLDHLQFPSPNNISLPSDFLKLVQSDCHYCDFGFVSKFLVSGVCGSSEVVDGFTVFFRIRSDGGVIGLASSLPLYLVVACVLVGSEALMLVAMISETLMIVNNGSHIRKQSRQLFVQEMLVVSSVDVQAGVVENTLECRGL
ncbi:hypothetical protein Tco_0429825 [Tanacetum coccineum]